MEMEKLRIVMVPGFAHKEGKESAAAYAVGDEEGAGYDASRV